MTMQLEFINRCRPQVVLSRHRKNISWTLKSRFCCTNVWSVMGASYNSHRRERGFLKMNARLRDDTLLFQPAKNL